MFHQCQNPLFHRRAMMRGGVRAQDFFTVRQIPIVAVREHFVGGKARLPVEFALRFADVEVKRAAIHQRVISAERRQAECAGDVAVPEIAFASRRCNKTGHNQQ